MPQAAQFPAHGAYVDTTYKHGVLSTHEVH